MLRETLKKEIDQLSESHLQAIADYVNALKAQTQLERSEDFRQWVTQLPHTNVTLADDAFDRGSIYE